MKVKKSKKNKTLISNKVSKVKKSKNIEMSKISKRMDKKVLISF